MILLDFSAAFDAIDMDHLSGVALGSTVLWSFWTNLEDKFQMELLRNSCLIFLAFGVLQNSILCNIYMKLLGNVTWRFGLGYHQYYK